MRRLEEREREVFVPLAFAPGERAEVDWGTTQVVLTGRVTMVHLFCRLLRYSGTPSLTASPHERQETFLAGYRRTFDQ